MKIENYREQSPGSYAVGIFDVYLDKMQLRLRNLKLCVSKKGTHFLGYPSFSIEEIIAKETAFYKCMTDFTPPEGKLPRREDLETMEGVLAAIKIRDKISKKKEELKELEEEYDICKQGLAYLSDNSSFECKGYQVRKIISPGRVDYKKIPLLKDMDLSPFRGEPIEYWRII